VNQTASREILSQTRIFGSLSTQFGHDPFWWQQDNAPPHHPLPREIALQHKILLWPPYSPDLSPIEQMWAIIQKKLKEKGLAAEEARFQAIFGAWAEALQKMIHNG
jgi:hypothetical protein